MAILQIANNKFRNLDAEQRKIMIMAVREDDRRMNEGRQ